MDSSAIELINLFSQENEPDGVSLHEIIRLSTLLNGSCIGIDALFRAVAKGFSNSVEIILEAGVSPNMRRKNNKKSALHLACEKESTETILVLLKYGAEVNAEGPYKETPLHVASLKGNTETMKILLQNGAMVNAVDLFGRTPLYCTFENSGCQPSAVSAAEVLLSAGADVNFLDGFGLSPLHTAVEHNQLKIIRLLLRYGADINIKDLEGNAPIHFYFLTMARKVPHETIRELVKAKANLNSLNNKGHSPLFYTLENADVESTQLLLRCGASFDLVECLVSMEKSVSEKLNLKEIRKIAKEFIRYDCLKNVHSVISTRHQQLRQERLVNTLRTISSRRICLHEFHQTCLSEVEALSKMNCDCGKSSIWDSMNSWKVCHCDTQLTILKFLFSGRKSNFTDAFFYKLDEDFLLEITLSLLSYYELKSSKKLFILPWPCVKEIERYVSIEDAVSFLQCKQSEMDASEYEKFLKFMNIQCSAQSSSKISPPASKKIRES